MYAISDELHLIAKMLITKLVINAVKFHMSSQSVT